MDTLTKILSLISVATILYYYYKKWVKYNEEIQKKTWPLRYPDCPDYWELTEDGSCDNKFALGECPNEPNPKDFNENSMYTLENKTDKAKQVALKNRGVWARSCNVTWEGIDKLPAPDANDGLPA